MGLSSPVETLDYLFLNKMPTGRVIKMKHAIRSGSLTILVGDNGKLYCDRLHGYHYCPGEYPWLDPFMKSLVKLKVITKEEHDQHLKWNEECYTERNNKRLHESLLNQAKEAGIKFNNSQKKKIDKLINI